MDAFSNNIEIGFWQLISNISKVEIPIIQRDFAQGRSNEKAIKIRELFLDSLIKAIESDTESIELDFVYGDIKNGIFQPLDGQQRLTTLYLLYWYLAYKTGNLLGTKNNFKKFTYETRISSREFCNELVENGEKLGEGETINEKIIDSSWFFLSWKNDPTIKAMLVMLNSIESKLNGKSQEELSKEWNKLISEKPPITFYFKQLNDIGLTDDLYIKMNARGKALTDFENFKARFDGYVRKVIYKKDDDGKDILKNGAYVILKDNWEKEITDPTETFSHKIDTVWTDLFWKHRGDDNLVDNEFIKFIAGIAINSYAENQEIIKSKDEDKLTRKILEEKKEKNITDDAVKRERIERRITLLFNNPNEIMPEDFPTKTSFEYLKSCFDIYSHKESEYDELRPKKLILWEYFENQKVKINSEQEVDNSLFIEFVRSDKANTYKQRVLFYAQTQYLLHTSSFEDEAFADWMRVVRNIVQNVTIDSAERFIGAIGLIREMSKGWKNIYKYLDGNSMNSDFASSQVSEEVLKAKLIQEDSIWKNQLFKIEDDSFLKGEIIFLLEFAKTDNSFNYQNFKDISDSFLLLFAQKDDLLRVAILTQDDYAIWDGYTYSLEADRYSLLNSDIEWKEALRKKHEKLLNAISKLLLFAKENEGNRNDILRKAINNYNYNNDYRDWLIKNNENLKNWSHKRICLNASGTILYLLEKTRVVGNNYREVLFRN